MILAPISANIVILPLVVFIPSVCRFVGTVRPGVGATPVAVFFGFPSLVFPGDRLGVRAARVAVVGTACGRFGAGSVEGALEESLGADRSCGWLSVSVTTGAVGVVDTEVSVESDAGSDDSVVGVTTGVDGELAAPVSDGCVGLAGSGVSTADGAGPAAGPGSLLLVDEPLVGSARGVASAPVRGRSRQGIARKTTPATLNAAYPPRWSTAPLFSAGYGERCERAFRVMIKVVLSFSAPAYAWVTRITSSHC